MRSARTFFLGLLRNDLGHLGLRLTQLLHVVGLGALGGEPYGGAGPVTAQQQRLFAQ
jgi:hypothetical protein